MATKNKKLIKILETKNNQTTRNCCILLGFWVIVLFLIYFRIIVNNAQLAHGLMMALVLYDLGKLHSLETTLELLDMEGD